MREILTSHLAACQRKYGNDLRHAVCGIAHYPSEGMAAGQVDRLLESPAEAIWAATCILDYMAQEGAVSLTDIWARLQVLGSILHSDQEAPLYLCVALHPDTEQVAGQWHRLNGGMLDRPGGQEFDARRKASLPYVSMLLDELGSEAMHEALNGGYLDRACRDDEQLWSPRWVWKHKEEMLAWQREHGRLPSSV